MKKSIYHAGQSTLSAAGGARQYDDLPLFYAEIDMLQLILRVSVGETEIFNFIAGFNFSPHTKIHMAAVEINSAIMTPSLTAILFK